MLLTINYHTGVKENVEVASLEEAKQLAYDGISYTQENVSIQTPDGETITAAKWYGVRPEDDDQILCTIAEGFYQLWDDEL